MCMQFPIIIEKDEDGYFAKCVTLQGCVTSGDTYEEALENIKDAIKLYVSDCIENNELILANQMISISLVDLPIKLNE